MQTRNNAQLWPRPQAPQDSNVLFTTSFRSTATLFFFFFKHDSWYRLVKHGPRAQASPSNCAVQQQGQCTKRWHFHMLQRRELVETSAAASASQLTHLCLPKPTLLFQPQVPFPASPALDPLGPLVILLLWKRHQFSSKCHQHGSHPSKALPYPMQGVGALDTPASHPRL